MKGVKCKNCYHLEGEWCELVVDSPDPDMVRDCRYFMQKTNADRIRAMSDEELAKALMKALTIGCPPVECGGWKTSCEQCWSYWLKQPAKEGEDDG